jgi:hypothetical protein
VPVDPQTVELKIDIPKDGVDIYTKVDMENPIVGRYEYSYFPINRGSYLYQWKGATTGLKISGIKSGVFTARSPKL